MDLDVLLVLHAFPPETMAGTEVVTLSLARELARRGHRVTVLHRTGDPGQPEGTITETAYDGLRVLRLARHDRSRTLAETDRDAGVDAAFRELLQREAPDVVHFQHLLHLSARLPLICREQGVPSILTVHDFWFRCPKVQLIRDDGRLCAGPPPLLGCAVCLDGRPGEIDALARLSRPLARPLQALATSSFPAAAHRLPGGARMVHLAQVAERPARMMQTLLAPDFVIAPSRFMKEKMVEAGVPAKLLIVSDNGMETAWLETYRPRVSDGRVRFGFVGSLVWYKGLEVLARAFALLGDPRAELHVHGDGESAAELREVAARARAAAGASPSVVFHGAFTPSRLGEVLGSIDVLVVPSLWYENSPLTIHEAFQARLPVLASDHGGLRDLVWEGKGGLRFRAGDEKDLARVMRLFLEDPALAGRLAAAAPEVKSVAVSAAEMEVKYRQAIGLRPAREAPASPEARPRASTDARAPAPTLSVVIPTLDGRALLAECLDGLAGQDYPRDRVEVVVVDNASSDGTVEWLRQSHPGVRVVSLASNLGFAEPCNRGAEAASGEWLVLLNNDAVPEEGFLSALVRRAGGEGVAAVGGRILSADGRDVEFGGAGLSVFGFGFQRSSWQPGFGETAPGAEMPFACGGAMLARRDVFLDLGGFDADYFAYYEDVDLGWRLNLSGHRVVYAPEARVRHRKHATSSRFSDRWRHFHWYKNTLQTLVKNSEAPYAARLLPAAFLLLLSRVGSFLETAAEARSRGDEGEAQRYLDIAVGAGEGLSWLLTHAERVMAKRAAVQARRRVGDQALEERFGFALDFGPETAHWAENARALELLALTDLSSLLDSGRVAEALAEHRRSVVDAASFTSASGLDHPRIETGAAETARLRHEIETIRKSLTWRLSAPLRHLMDRLRG
jgi:GT2 family glycosyltransferase/glycosyltransferase involved in cell wall biosynthesis